MYMGLRRFKYLCLFNPSKDVVAGVIYFYIEHGIGLEIEKMKTEDRLVKVIYPSVQTLKMVIFRI